MRKKIWDEMTTARFRMEYVVRYGVFQRRLASIANAVVLISSTAGILGWDISSLIPGISCVIIGIISWVKFLFPKTIMSKDKIESVEKINRFYTEYYNDMSKLWDKYENKDIDDTQAIDKFHEIKSKESDIDSLVNDTIKYNLPWIKKSVRKENDKYFKSLETNYEQENN